MEKVKRIILLILKVIKNIIGSLLFLLGAFLTILSFPQKQKEAFILCCVITVIGFLIVFAGSKTSKKINKRIGSWIDALLEKGHSKLREQTDKIYREELAKQLAKTPEQWDAEEKKQRDKIIKMVLFPFKIILGFFLILALSPILVVLAVCSIIFSPDFLIIIFNLIAGFLSGLFG